MKRLISISIIFLYLLFLSSCRSMVHSTSYVSDTVSSCEYMKYKISYVNDTGKEKNIEHIELIRSFIIENTPNLNLNEYSEMFDYMYNVTPDGFENKCTIYHFDHAYEKVPLNFELQTIMIIDNELIFLGSAWGGHGVTEFAYLNCDYFYFIYSCGSGVHSSYISMYNFNDQSFSSYGEWKEPFIHGDISFCLINEGRKLGVCNSYTGEVIYEDITKLEFSNDKNSA